VLLLLSKLMHGVVPLVDLGYRLPFSISPLVRTACRTLVFHGAKTQVMLQVIASAVYSRLNRPVVFVNRYVYLALTTRMIVRM